MQRALTILGVLILFGVGTYAIAGGFNPAEATYVVPSDPILATVLAASVGVVLALTLGMGGGLAFLFNLLSKQLGQSSPGPLSEAKPDANVVAPYVPAYSYRRTEEKDEIRQWVIGAAVGALALVVITFWLGRGKVLENLPLFDVTMWAVAVGGTVALIGGTIVTGAGLAFWFYRTEQEKDKAATLTEPAWPSKQIAALESKIRSGEPLDMIRQMTFLDKALIAFNVGIVLVILGVIAVWVAPGVAQVMAVDALRRPVEVAVVAQATPAAPPADPMETLKAEFAALPAGDATAGQAAFAAQACAACHNVQSDAVLVGPPLLSIGTTAESRKPDYTAELYIYESIVRPGAYVVEGFTDGVMPQNFAQILSAQQIADIVAYLQTLK